MKPVVISGDIVEKIFYKISAILQCHQLFQIALAGSVNNWDEHECIGETFVASVCVHVLLVIIVDPYQAQGFSRNEKFS